METSSSEAGGDPPQQLFALIDALQQPGTAEWIMLLLIVLLIAASALISGSEVAFFSLSKGDLDDLDKESESQSGAIRKLLAKPQELLATILISNNLVNVSIIVLFYFFFKGIIVTDLPNPYIEYGIKIGLVTLILVLFGEVIPKLYASHNNVRVAAMMHRPLLGLRTAFAPASNLLVNSSTIIERKLQKMRNHELNANELERAIDLTSGHRSTDDEVNMLKGIVNFGNIQVKQIMKSRVDMIAVEDCVTFNELMDIIRESGYSRIPVYSENLDNITGILYVKDLLEFLDKTTFKWQELIRDALFVPEGKKIDDVLKEMQEKRVHMVIAVDEYGGTAGIVTLEDILEEVIGDIKDEYDVLDEIDYEQIDERTFIFEGKTLINDICKVLKIKEDTFEDIRGESDSLAGLVLEIAGRFPDPDETIVYDQFDFTVLSVDNHRIERVKLTINEDAG